MKKIILLILLASSVFTGCQARQEVQEKADAPQAKEQAPNAVPERKSFDTAEIRDNYQDLAAKVDKPPMVEITMSVSECSSNLSATDATRAFMYAKASALVCYRDTLIKNDKLQIQEKVLVTLEPNGQMKEVRFGKELENADLSACLKKAFKEMRFPKTRDEKEANIEYDMKLVITQPTQYVDPKAGRKVLPPRETGHNHNHGEE